MMDLHICMEMLTPNERSVVTRWPSEEHGKLAFVLAEKAAQPEHYRCQNLLESLRIVSRNQSDA